MFRNRKKHANKVFLKKAVIYKYRKDTGQLDIYPNCMLFQKNDKNEYYARGMTKIIGPENLTIIGGKPGEIFESENDILFWLQEQDDVKAKKIVCQYIIDCIDSTIEDCLKNIENAQKLSTAVLLNYYEEFKNKDTQIDDIQDRVRMYNTAIMILKTFLLNRSKHVSN